MKKITLLILFTILFIGCSEKENVHFEFPQNEDLNIKIYYHDTNKVTVKECTVKSTTEKFFQIKNLLNNNSGEWGHEFATFRQHTIVSNSKFNVNIVGQRMIVQRHENQYSHIIQINYHDLLNCDFETNKNE